MSFPPPNSSFFRLLTSDYDISEFLCIGDKLLFREGRTKGLGIVKALGYDSDTPLVKED